MAVDQIYLLSAIQSKYKNGEFTDVVVRYGDQCQYSVKAHRLVLCAASDFFHAMLGKKGFMENEQGVVKLPMIEDEAVGRVLLDCIYGKDYNELAAIKDNLAFHLNVFFAADYCRLPRMKNVVLDAYISSARTIFRAAEEARERRMIYNYMNEEDSESAEKDDRDVRMDFIQAVKTVYERTPPTDKVLRPAVANLCLQIRHELRKDARLAQATREIPDLAIDIASIIFRGQVEAHNDDGGEEDEDEEEEL